ISQALGQYQRRHAAIHLLRDAIRQGPNKHGLQVLLFSVVTTSAADQDRGCSSAHHWHHHDVPAKRSSSAYGSCWKETPTATSHCIARDHTERPRCVSPGGGRTRSWIGSRMRPA